MFLKILFKDTVLGKFILLTFALFKTQVHLHKAITAFLKFLLVALLFIGLNPIEKKQSLELKANQNVALTSAKTPFSTAENVGFVFNISVSSIQISKSCLAFSNRHTQLVVNRFYNEIIKTLKQVFPKFSKVFIPFPFHFFY